MIEARAVNPWPSQRRNTVILPHDVEWCPLGQLTTTAGLDLVSGTWTTANTAVGFWITAPYGCTVKKMTVANGSAAGGNWCVAIYDSDGTTRLVSTGSFAGSGNSAFNAWQDTTDQALTEGKDYFVAVNHDSTTANRMQRAMDQTLYQLGHFLLGTVKVQAVGAVTLPDPFVPADPTAVVSVPLVALSLDANT